MIKLDLAIKASIIIMLISSYLSIVINLIIKQKFTLKDSIILYLTICTSPFFIPLYVFQNKTKIVDAIIEEFKDRLDCTDNIRKNLISSKRFTFFLITSFFKHFDSTMHSLIDELPLRETSPTHNNNLSFSFFNLSLTTSFKNNKNLLDKLIHT